ncbi:hypothetical protein AB0M41_32120 [Streptomyces sp. NPDC051896]|uniref:hypothetical protein n=1 Tax=Streptomyces sp. NPDC051896 TaxID=3155416 RepID=UPI00342BA4DC
MRLQLAGQGEAETTLTVDHVLAATAIASTWTRPPSCRPRCASLACVRCAKAPQLSTRLGSPVPGLYCTGSLAAPMFSPMMRFVTRTEFVARRITRHASRPSVPR